MKRARKEAGKKLLDFMRSWNKWQRQNFASWLDIIFGRSAQLRQDLGRKSRGKYLRHTGRTSICEMHRRVGNPTKLPGKCNLLEHRAKLVSCCCCCRCCCCCCLCPPTAFALEVIFVHSSLRLNCHKGPFTHTHTRTLAHNVTAWGKWKCRCGVKFLFSNKFPFSLQTITMGQCD